MATEEKYIFSFYANSDEAEGGLNDLTVEDEEEDDDDEEDDTEEDSEEDSLES